MQIGVLAIQGSVEEHTKMLEACGVEPVLVRSIEDLERVQGLIIPGGESTTISRLMKWYDLFEEIKRRTQGGMPVYGTCAGAILLAREVDSGGSKRKRSAQRKLSREKPTTLGLIDIELERNAYGRQMDSFEAEVELKLGKRAVKFPGVFIRAPRIAKMGSEVEGLGTYRVSGKEGQSEIVMVRQGNILVSMFHPELTKDKRVHEYFVGMVRR